MTWQASTALSCHNNSTQDHMLMHMHMQVASRTTVIRCHARLSCLHRLPDRSTRSTIRRALIPLVLNRVPSSPAHAHAHMHMHMHMHMHHIPTCTCIAACASSRWCRRHSGPCRLKDGNWNWLGAIGGTRNGSCHMSGSHGPHPHHQRCHAARGHHRHCVSV